MRRTLLTLLAVGAVVCYASPGSAGINNRGTADTWSFVGHELTPQGVAGSGLRILYAPSDSDDAGYRAALAARLGGAVVDYYDARAGTPSLALLDSYDGVMTWTDFSYDNAVLFGNTLADFVDQGGAVVLGAFSAFTSGHSLSGRIMSDPAYCPVRGGFNHFSHSTWSGDDTGDCLQRDVVSYGATYRDILTLDGTGASAVGHYIDGEIALAHNAGRSVVYANGAGGAPIDGGMPDFDLVVANAFLCQTLPTTPLVIRNYCPPAWQGTEVNWNRDVAPRNRIDDLIDAAPIGYFDVIVNFRRCVETADVNELNALSGGGVQMVYEYITSVAVGHVTEATIRQIAALESVAFIEKQLPFSYFIDVSVPTLKVTASATYSPSTVADCQPGIDGTGVNIVIMDSGVDNPGSTGAGPFHQAFAATPVIAGYDVVTSSYLDPDDLVGHGTHVASIALGQVTTGTSRGVAPKAGLIDVRLSTGASIPPLAPSQGLQVVYNNRSLWNVRVINMSFGGGAFSNGLDSFSQLCDLAEAMGIVIVVAVGNAGPGNAGLVTPAVATRAITVAGSNDLETITRNPDVIYGSSSKGPRSSDGDFDCIDELKPEVTAPGENITAAQFNTLNGSLTASGTSMAAPHVAGVAALIIQAFPTINPASVKDRIIKSCQQLGPIGMSSCDLSWSDRWGWGLVDAYAAVCAPPSSNPTFPNCPANPSWVSMDLSTNPFPPQVGQPCTVRAMITNPSPNPAFGVKVNFGIHDFSGSTPAFYDIGTATVNLAASQLIPVPVSMMWTPMTPGHQCLSAEIGYAFDSDYGCNSAQRNITVAQSPVTFQVKNTITEGPQRIYFVATFENPGGEWDVDISPPDVVLGADDCARDITVLLIPVTAAPGDTQIVHVAARMDTPEYGTVELGGVSVLDVNEATGVGGRTTHSAQFGLRLAGGNPFRSGTTIHYAIESAAAVRLALYDVKGRLIASVFDGASMAGEHSVSWDGRDRRGKEVPAGVYFLRLESGGRTTSRELVLVR